MSFFYELERAEKSDSCLKKKNMCTSHLGETVINHLIIKDKQS